MADPLFHRVCRLILSVPVATKGDYTHTTTDRIEINAGGADGTQGLRVRFRVAKTTEKEPNPAVVTVTNLSPDVRGSLQGKGVKVQLEAGYEAVGVTRLFLGDARIINHVREGAEWQSEIKASDGSRSWRYARASQSWAEGVTAGDVLRYLAGQSGLALGNVPLEVSSVPGFSRVFSQGYVVDGPVRASIDRLVRSLGFAWSIQDNALQVIAPGRSIEAAIPDITPDSGLVGSPEAGTPEKKGGPALIKFKALLFPARPGAKVHLRSERYNGQVTIKRAVYDGDTDGGPWYTECEGTIAKAAA